MSRSAVSAEHLQIAAHLLLVSFPSKPSSSRLSTLTWRSLSGSSRPPLPESGLGQHGIEGLMGLIQRAVKAVEEPREPTRDIHIAFLEFARESRSKPSGPAGSAPRGCKALQGCRPLGRVNRSPMALAIRPLPSSNRCSVTNHRCPNPALRRGGISVSALSQSRKQTISRGRHSAGGASK